MLKYLRPSMRMWLVAAAVGLIAIARLRPAAPTPTRRTGRRSSPRRAQLRPRIGWLLVVPIAVLILFGPQPMGDFAIGRTPNLPPYAFDIAKYTSDTEPTDADAAVR